MMIVVVVVIIYRHARGEYSADAHEYDHVRDGENIITTIPIIMYIIAC
jgi:heme/copper-type cytochrome/quinol oxidase subunit 2